MARNVHATASLLLPFVSTTKRARSMGISHAGMLMVGVVSEPAVPKPYIVPGHKWCVMRKIKHAHEGKSNFGNILHDATSWNADAVFN